MCSSLVSLLSSVTDRERAPHDAASAGWPMSSLIVLGIVAIWILVLVPMWLNRHEADNASRSMDTFTTAMRVLSRRPPARADRRYVVMPRRESWGVTVDNALDERSGRRPLLRRSARPTSAVSGRARLMARRRRIAVVFAVLTVGLACSAAFAHTSWWFEVAADLLLVGYVVHLRNQAIRTAELRRRASARDARARAPRPSSSAFEAARPGAARRDFDGALGADRVPVGVLADALVAAGSAVGTENGSRWEPVPVPLPTYVSKPVVSRPAAAAPRADVESGAVERTWVDTEVDVRYLLLDESASDAVSAAVGDGSPDELDVILERRRAVGD
jgi:hypothetical protein